MEITIGNKKYNVKEAKSQEELTNGLKGVTELPEDEGMLFYMPDQLSQQVFTMEGMKIPIDIIFIDQDQDVVDVRKNCQPDDPDIVSSTEYIDDDGYIEYVLEVNPNSGIKVGDSLDFGEDEPVMRVLAQDGSTQMDLWGGERIFRRAFTKQIINWAKKAIEVKEDKEKYDSICKRLGRKMFKEIKAQDTRPAEYVQAPNQ